jgi:tetratricopeptide (TPR) repeat protein
LNALLPGYRRRSPNRAAGRDGLLASGGWRRRRPAARENPALGDLATARLDAAMSAPTWEIALEALRVALAARDRARTNAAVQTLLAGDAPLGAQWRSIAELMQVSGELNLAVRAIDAFVTASGGAPRAQVEKVVVLTQAGRMREAHDLMTSLPDTEPDRAGRAYLLGNTAMSLGRVEEAREQLALAARLRPGWGPAWLSLAATGELDREGLGERLLADAGAAERQAPGDHARYCYARGRLHADRGEHGPAFAAYAKGAGLLRSLTPYSRGGNARTAAAAMSGFDGDLLQRMAARQTLDTRRPIFVTGLPRSGTTLVEQILASHSGVTDGGELTCAHHVAVAVGGVTGEAIEKHLAEGGSPEAMAGLYLHLIAERFGAAGRVVDKTVDASRRLGLIAAMLPDAPLIWMRRDPLDSAWSCFRTFFVHGVAWSYDLADIAHHFRLEDALLAYWRKRLGDRLLVVPYAELVEQPELWTRRLLAHCGLGEEAGVHAAHRTERVVRTASALQVRRPINRDGLNVAEPYREHLQPFVEAYSG